MCTWGRSRARGCLLAALVLAASGACRRPATEPPPPSAIPAPDAAAAPAWKVVQVEREPIVLRTGEGIADVYPDGTSLTFTGGATKLMRRERDGSARWTTALAGTVTITDAIAGDDDTWILGYTEASIRITSSVRWSPSARDPVKSVLVLLRLDSRSGAIVAATIAADRDHYPARMVRSGAGLLVVSTIGRLGFDVIRYDQQATRLASTRLAERFVDGPRATADGGACVTVTLAADDELPGLPDQYHWCLDQQFQTASRLRVAADVLGFWTTQRQLAGRVEQRSRLDYELHVMLPPQPDLIVESVCRVLESISPLEALTLIDKDNNRPDVDLGCEGTRVLLHATFGINDWKAVALYARADVTIAGHPVPLPNESLLLLRITPDHRVTYSVHPAPRFVLPRRNRLAVALHPDRAEVFDFAQLP